MLCSAFAQLPDKSLHNLLPTGTAEVAALATQLNVAVAAVKVCLARSRCVSCHPNTFPNPRYGPCFLLTL